MKIYLLNPPFLPNFVRFSRWQGVAARGGCMYYPIWLASATGVLEERYKDVKLVDAITRKWSNEETLQDVKEFAPNLIVIDCNFSSLSNDIQITKLLKENLERATTVMVGPPASQFPNRILQNEGVDIIARFEYDFILKEIAQAIESGTGLSNIKGISYKEAGKVVHNPDREFTTSEDLDRMPFVSRVYKKHLHIEGYFLSHSLYPEVQIMTSRGCPNLCTFCSWPRTLMGRKYRTRSSKNVVDEFEYVKKELPQVKEIFLEDDTFAVGAGRVGEICEEIHRRRLKISWACQVRADLDYDTLKMMKQAGCRLVDVGYESGNNEILQNIKKGLTTEQMRRFTRDAKKAGLMIMADFIFGLPGETKKTAEETVRFAKELKPNIVQFVPATPIPGTEFYEWVQENGFLVTDNLEESIDKEGFQKCIVSYPEFTNKETEDYIDQALKRYYLSPSYIPVAISNVMRRDGWCEFKEMVKSARIFFTYLRRGKAKG